MIKPSDTIMLIKKDFDSGVIVKKEHDGLLEYWVYESASASKLGTNGLILGATESVSETKLKYIILCENDPKHINIEHTNHLVVSGIRFSDEEDSKDLTDYLTKTGRSI